MSPVDVQVIVRLVPCIQTSPPLGEVIVGRGGSVIVKTLSLRSLYDESDVDMILTR